MYLMLLVLQFPEWATREKVLSIHLLSRLGKFFCRGMHVSNNIHRGANQGKTSMPKGALVKKFTNLNSFRKHKQKNHVIYLQK